MNIQCVYDKSFGGYHTFVTFDGDDNIYYEDFAWTKEQLVVDWRFNLPAFVEQIERQTREEVEREYATRFGVVDPLEKPHAHTEDGDALMHTKETVV